MQSVSGIIMVLVLFALMYFLMIRPQKKRQSKHAELLKHLSKGDHVVTISRLHGVIDDIDRKKQEVSLDCDGIYLVFDLRAIASVTKDTGTSKAPKSSKSSAAKTTRPNSKAKK